MTPPPDGVPPVALEYQPPQPSRRRMGDMGWGILISLFLANGAGWFVFGALMMLGHRDDHAGPIAVGVAFMVLGAALAAPLALSRREQRRNPR